MDFKKLIKADYRDHGGFPESPPPKEEPAPNAEQQAVIDAVDSGRNIMLTGPGGCVDKDTEFLSPEGWVKISEWDKHSVAQYHPDSGSITFDRPLEYHNYPASTWYTFITKYGLNQKLSAEHRVAYITSKGNFTEKKMEDVYSMHEKSRDGFSGEFVTTFSVSSQGGLFKSKPLPDSLIRLFVAISADGHFIPKRPGHIRIRLKKQRKIDRMKMLLDECRVPYDLRPDNAPGFVGFHVFLPSAFRKFPLDWWTMPSSQLKVVADEALLWDGCVKKGRKLDARMNYFSGIKSNADFIQYAFSATGRRATITVDLHRKNPNYVVNATNRCTTTLVGGKGYKSKILKTEPAPGDRKYCFTTGTTYWVARRGDRIFVTGNTGKSFVVGKLRDKYGYDIALTSTTGVASLLIGGNTIHSWAGLGLGEGTPGQIAKRIGEKGGRTQDRIINCERLVIDEVSMLSAELFTKLDHVFRMVCETEEPFGGIQIICVGDFLQLPPVIKFQPAPFDQEELMPKEEVGRYTFDSKSWAEAQIQVHELKTIVRQKDRVFAEVLNKVRLGIVDPQVLEVLQSRVTRFVDDGTDIRPMKVFSTNASVDAINMQELAKIESPEKLFTAKYTGLPWAIDNLKKNCLAQEHVRLKVGAQVMLLRNVDLDSGLVNGSMGVIKNFAHGTPQVEFANGVVYDCEPEQWEIKDGTNVLATCQQVPLKLGYAATIHKMQGATVDKAELDLGNCFEFGQAYVALSRCRTLPGMYLTDFKASSIKACPRAKAFYGHK